MVDEVPGFSDHSGRLTLRVPLSLGQTFAETLVVSSALKDCEHGTTSDFLRVLFLLAGDDLTELTVVSESVAVGNLAKKVYSVLAFQDLILR